jgi:phosphoadenosine phosphosulfate reductase
MQLTLPHNSPVLSGVADGLNRHFADATASDVLRFALSDLGQAAVVSSFGAESAVLLHMTAQIDLAATVVFVDTEMLFEETLAYQQTLAEHLGLSGVIVMRAGLTRQLDPQNDLHTRDPDACCALRKTAPLQNALRGYDVWISGRKRFQSDARAALPLFEHDALNTAIKVNPLANWSPQDVQAYLETHALPRHPLVKQGFASIGCAPCTSPVSPGEDPRAGRWRGQDKTECGIHFQDGQAIRSGAST